MRQVGFIYTIVPRCRATKHKIYPLEYFLRPHASSPQQHIN